MANRLYLYLLEIGSNVTKKQQTSAVNAWCTLLSPQIFNCSQRRSKHFFSSSIHNV